MSRAYYNSGAAAFFTAKLEDDQGVALGFANLATLELTVRDPLTGLFPSSRENQNVKAGSAGVELNGVTVDATSGQMDWKIGVPDVTPADATADFAIHVAIFRYTGTVAGRPVSGELVHELVLLPPDRLMLCSIDDVEHHLGRIQDADLPRIEREILAVSRRAESYTGRRFKYRAGEEQFFSSRFWEPRALFLLRFPVSSIETLEAGANGLFITPSSPAQAIAPEDYALTRGGVLGRQPAYIRLRIPRYVDGADVIHCVYTGGAWRETAAVDQDMRAACAEQVAYRYQRRDTLGVTGMSAGQGGSVSFGQSGDTSPFIRYEKDVLASVRAVWDDYRAFQPSF